MKQVVLVLGIIGVLLLVTVAVFLKKSRAAATKLSDGSSVALVEAFVGPHRGVTQIEKPWMKWARRLPPSIRDVLPFLPVLPSSSGRSWYHVPADTNSLHVWLKRLDAVAKQPQLDDYRIVITDSDGWAWMNHGVGHSGMNATSRVDFVNYSFSGFPRWAESLELHLLHSTYEGGGYQAERLGSLRIPNPVYSEPPTNWTVHPLPQMTTVSNVQVVLDRLEFAKNWESQRMPKDLGTINPAVNLKVTTLEKIDGTVVTNGWYEVVKSFFDNYGNNSHGGLPPLRPTDTNVPPLQWRIALDMVADHRSQVASNYFASLQPGRLPATGEFVPADLATNSAGALKVWLIGWMGPGQAEYTNGILETNFVPVALPNRLRDSMSSSTDSKGNVVRRIRITSDSPHVAVGYDGTTDGVWFSMRATDSEESNPVWLDKHGEPSSVPRFQRVYNDPHLIWFSGEGLDTNRTWHLSFGVHYPQRFEFFIDRPVAPAELP